MAVILRILRVNLFQLRYLFFAQFCFVLVLSASCSKNSNESEPNNNFDELQSISFGEIIKGSIESAEDRDLYSLKVEKEGQVSLSLSSLKGINHQIVVYRQIGDKYAYVKRIDDSRKSSSEFMPALGVVPGTYCFEISHGERDLKKGNADQSYTFRIEQLEDEVYEFEPNDIPEKATQLESGNSIKAYFSPSFNKLNTSRGAKYREYDYFSFEVTREQAGKFLVDLSVSDVAGVDSVVTMYNPSGFKINSSDIGAISVGESIMGQGLADAGIYIIEVFAKNYASNPELPYAITLNISQFDSSLEMERNNSYESANLVRGGIIKGRIFPEGDEDFFIYIPERPQFVDISLTPSPAINGRFALYDSKNELVYEVDNSGAGMTEKFPSFFASDKFYIKVLAFSGEIDSERFYNLTINTSNQQESVEIEPNDTKDRATFIDKELIYGFSSVHDDTDYFLIEKSLKGEYLIKVNGVLGAKFEISITDNLGYVINSYQLDGEESLEIKELINKRAYLIVKTISPVFEKPYIIEIETPI